MIHMSPFQSGIFYDSQGCIHCWSARMVESVVGLEPHPRQLKSPEELQSLGMECLCNSCITLYSFSLEKFSPWTFLQ